MSILYCRMLHAKTLGNKMIRTHLFCETDFLLLALAALFQKAREISSDSLVLLLRHARLLLHKVNEKPVVENRRKYREACHAMALSQTAFSRMFSEPWQSPPLANTPSTHCQA